MDERSPLYMTRLKLQGKVKVHEVIPDEADEVEDTALLDAISELSAAIKSIAPQSVDVDFAPVVSELKNLQDRISKKRKWKFNIVRDDEGDISDIMATEI